MRRIQTAILLSVCVTGVCAAASISGVTNGANTVPSGLPGSGIAQGAIFTIYGNGIGPSTFIQAFSYPLPTTQGLGGTTVQVTVNGVTNTCIMVYALSSQVAAILPSTTPVGTGTVTVHFQGATASSAIQVVAAGFGTLSLNEAGTGPAVITDTSYNPITMVNPAHPGESLILWGTGLGAVTGDETVPPQEVNLNSGVQVFIENQSAVVSYGGRSSVPALDQINFTVPLGISGGCRTSIAVLVKGITGNVTTTAIAPAGQATCGDTFGVLTASSLEKAVATGTLNVGGVTLYRFGTNGDTFSASFGSYPLNSLIRSYGGSLGGSIGSCTAYELLGSSVTADPVTPNYLDAGTSLTLTGPEGSRTVAASSTGLYTDALGAAGSYIQPGAYTISNGGGGSNVSGFNWALTLPQPITLTNFPAVINRNQDLTLAWSNAGSYQAVSLFGVSGVPLSSGQTAYVEFYCTAAASAGQFTIPSVILQLLPTNGFGASGSAGVAIEAAGVETSTFNAGGSPGIDAAVFNGFVYTGPVVKVE